MADTSIEIARVDGVNAADAPPARDDAQDPVLAALHMAEDIYESECRTLERRQAALDDARRQLSLADQRQQETQARLEDAEGRLRESEENRQQTEGRLRQTEDRRRASSEHAELERERARRLAEALRNIQRAVFGGNIYDLLLRACLTLTGATRGLYITVRGPDQRLRIRSAIDVQGYPSAPPSEYLKALCHRVLTDRDTLVVNSNDYRPDLPKAERQGEHFGNLVVTPVALQNGLDGVVIAADKIHGDFMEHDVEMLVAVGTQASVAVENHQLRCQLQAAYLTTITVLADAVEAKDAYTGGHFERVARYARRLGEELGLSARDVSVVYCGGLLHDVGKIGASDGLLNKPGALLPEEREVIHSHVRLGHDLVSKVPILKDAGDAVLYHHEWFDGNGYPDGLRGEEIPFSARIVAVADSYSAMVDRRSYKEPYSPEQARAELERCGGTQFDPKVVEAFLRVLERGALHEDEDVEDLSFAPLLAVAEPTPT